MMESTLSARHGVYMGLALAPVRPGRRVGAPPALLRPEPYITPRTTGSQGTRPTRRACASVARARSGVRAATDAHVTVRKGVRIYPYPTLPKPAGGQVRDARRGLRAQEEGEKAQEGGQGGEGARLGRLRRPGQGHAGAPMHPTAAAPRPQRAARALAAVVGASARARAAVLEQLLLGLCHISSSFALYSCM